MWKFDRRPRSIPAGGRLRVHAEAPFRLRWTDDGWATVKDSASTPTRVGVHFVDLEAPPEGRAPINFTFWWPEAGRWEGRDFEVDVARPT